MPRTGGEYLSLREMRIIREVYAERFKTLEGIYDEKFRALNVVLAMRDEELKLQAREYERRLGDLNNEHEQYRRDRARFLDAESHDQAHDALSDKIEAKFETTNARNEARFRPIEITLAEAKGKADQLTVNVTLGIASAGLLVALVSCIMGMG